MLGLVITLGSLLTLPAYAWPEVDHMNMCGSATKAVQGGFTNWAQYDRYVAKRGNAYYLRTNCPNTVAPTKKAAYVKKAVVKKSARIARSSKAKSFKRRVKYDEKVDCARVDRMNGYNVIIPKKARSKYRPAAKKVTYGKKAQVKRRYNYFKKS